MKKNKILIILLIACILVAMGLLINLNKSYAADENKVTLNFGDGIIHDGYVEYSKKAKVQLFKGDDLVTDISNNMVIDLNEEEYKFVIEEIEDTSVAGANTPIKLNINNWYYPMTTIVGETKSTFKLDSSKFSGALDVKFVRTGVAVNTKAENVYNDITSTGVIDLTNGQEYVIDFSKTDELTEGLKSFADLDKTLYYKRDNNSLLATDNESKAVIKIVGKRSENKAILTAVNVETKKSEGFKGFHMQYTGSALDFDDPDGGIILETRYDYYTRCTYEFTFQYVKEEVTPKVYEFTEGANQAYTIGKSKNATFRVNGELEMFKNILIDGKIVDRANYDVKSGSTIITLSDEYLKTLTVGEHTIKATFADNGEATTKFSIAIEEKIPEEKPEEEPKQEENNEISNPKTGDNIIVYFVTLTTAILGIITLVIVNNIKRKK